MGMSVVDGEAGRMVWRRGLDRGLGWDDGFDECDGDGETRLTSEVCLCMISWDTSDEIALMFSSKSGINS